MTGVGQGYEPPENADVVLDGDGEVETSVDQLLRALDVSR